MNITLNARAKILQLSDGVPFRIKATGDMIHGTHIDLIPDSDRLPLDDIICSAPPVVADFATISHLSGRLIDFDYKTDEFIITTKGRQ